MFLFAEIDCTNDDQDSLERRLMCRGLNIRPGGVRPNLEDYVRIINNSLVLIQVWPNLEDCVRIIHNSLVLIQRLLD